VRETQVTTTAQPEQTSSIGRLHKKFAIARWLQGSSMLQSSLMSISKLLSVLTEMNSGRQNFIPRQSFPQQLLITLLIIHLGVGEISHRCTFQQIA
jgi:hypothetical protein